jgi:hypothetical protein
MTPSRSDRFHTGRGAAWGLALGLAVACVPPSTGTGGGTDATGGTPTGTGGASGKGGGGGAAPAGTGGSAGNANTGGGGAGGSGSGGSGAGGTSGEGGVGPGTGGSGAGGSQGGDAPSVDAAMGDAPTDGRVVNMPPPLPDVAPPMFPPLAACAKPSVDHLTQFLAWSGTTTPPTGSNAISKDGNKTVGKISFKNCTGWCQLVVPINNSLGAQVDLSKSAGFLITYSSTADINMQMRPASRYDGGDKWLAFLPSTGGQMKELFYPFLPEAWYWLNRLGKPTYPFTTAVKDVRSFVFVSQVPNELTFYGFRIDGHDPACN